MRMGMVMPCLVLRRRRREEVREGSTVGFAIEIRSTGEDDEREPAISKGSSGGWEDTEQELGGGRHLLLLIHEHLFFAHLVGIGTGGSWREQKKERKDKEDMMRMTNKYNQIRNEEKRGDESYKKAYV
jgi:hypothetical protein